MASAPKTTSTPRRPASTSSLQSLSSMASQTPGGTQFLCPHRSHKQLDKLRSLKLAHNKLTRLALTTGLDAVEEELGSSFEDAKPTNISTTAKNVSSLLYTSVLKESSSAAKVQC